MGGFPTGVPNQWWRFILPIFLHTGCIDLLIAIVFQVYRGPGAVGCCEHGFLTRARACTRAAAVARHDH